jgi:hypothetical protein
MNYNKFIELSYEEQRQIDGGIVCGGLCIGAVITLGLAAGVGFGMGFVNRNREMQKENQ